MSNEYDVLGLYEHNAKAYKKVKETFASGEEVVGIVHATGTGKSYIALQLAYDNKDKKILYIVPSNSIIEHLKGIIEANSNLNLERDFPNLEFVTYQSFVNISREEIEELNFEMMVLDEFHHIGAPIWGQRVEMLRKTHPTAKVFGMTAYTVRDRGTAYERDMANPEGKELFSNKIVSTYDLCDAMLEGVLPKPIYKSAYIRLMEMAEELEKKVNQLDATSEEYRQYISIIEDAKKRIHQALNMDDVVKKHVRPDGKYIYFCPPGSVKGINDIETIKKEALKWFKEYVPEEDIIFYTSTSEMGLNGEKNRDAFYNDTTLDGQNAKGKLRIMFAINQFNEGVHTPGIDGVIMGRATESDIVYFEQLGRALSVRGDTKSKIEQYMKYSEEELIKICKRYEIPISDDLSKEEIIQRLIAPTVIDLTNNLEFIRQLENDLKDRLKQAKKANKDEKKEDKKIVLDDASFYLEIENIDIYEELKYVLDRLTMTWDDKYELAKAYYEAHGDLLIPKSFKTISGVNYDENGLSLGAWIKKQRQNYKKGTLPQDRIKKLELIGMVWTIKLTHDEQWNKMYQLAKTYYESHRNLLIPQGFKTTNGIDYDEKGLSLGTWINYQRQIFKKGTLPQDRIEKLELIGMVWTIKLTPDKQWNKMYELAKAYYEAHGDLLIPDKFKTINGIDYDEKGIKLGKWIRRQRENYKKGTISEERIEKLELIGMVWTARLAPSEQWNKMYELAKTYYESYGNLLMSEKFKTINGVDYDENGLSLGIWIKKQRVKYKNKTLSQDRIEKLEMIGMIWNPYDRQWDTMYQLAEVYYKTNGNLLIPQGFKTTNGIDNDENGLPLGIWISAQRQKYKKGTLPQDRIEKLETIGMVWTINLTPDKQWNKMYELAKTYYEVHGNLLVSEKFKTISGVDYDENGLSLGTWINTQRQNYKKGTLSQDRIEKLELIGMVWSIRKNKSEINELCEKHSINQIINKSIIGHISFKELETKINYLLNMEIPIYDEEERLHEIFCMSNPDMEEKYGINLEELITKYNHTRERK